MAAFYGNFSVEWTFLSVSFDGWKYCWIFYELFEAEIEALKEEIWLQMFDTNGGVNLFDFKFRDRGLNLANFNENLGKWVSMLTTIGQSY